MNNEFNWETAEYPYLGITEDDSIVCFSSYGCGHTTEDDDNIWKRGTYSDNWNMDGLDNAKWL
jgi:hypothetical protein